MKLTYFSKPDIVNKLRPYQHSVLEASAGTGKTFALEHIVLDILIEERAYGRRVGLEDILVLTFTERATQELKARIRVLIERCVTSETMHDEGETWEIDDSIREHLRGQLDQFTKASIYTIHGFCHRILNENAFLLGRALNEKKDSSGKIFDRAFKRALREKLSCEYPFHTFLEAWMENPRGTLGRLQSNLEQICRYEDPLYPEFKMVELKKILDELLLTPSAFDSFSNEMWSNYISGFAHDLSKCVTRYGDHGKVATYLQEADIVLGQLRGSANKKGDPIFKDFERVVFKSEGSALVRRLFFKTVSLEIAVLHLFSDVLRPYIKEEKLKGVFDYDDMLDGVYKRLNDDESGPLLDFLRSKYKYALVDEFQDTDTKQWGICKRIFVDAGPSNPLLLIGDPKQSIYAWRGADVETFLSARRTIEDRSGRGPIQLSTNFRSTGSMIAAYNAVFDQSVWRPFFGGPSIDYSQPVKCGNEDYEAYQHEGGFDDSHVIPIELIQPISKDSKLDAYALKRILGRWIAHEIDSLLCNPIEIHQNGVKRKLKASSIFILTHSHDEARFVGRFLGNFGIKHSFFKQDGLFQTQEADDIYHLLNAVASPYEKRLQLSAWATPFFGVPWDELRFYENLDETHPFLALLFKWNRLSRDGRFEKLFASIMEETGITRREIFDNEGNRRLTNYHHILETLLEESQREGADFNALVQTLHDFIHLRGFGKKDDRNVQRLDTDEDAVQLMTIHSSKGLEADVVFLFGGFSKPGIPPGVRFIHRGDKRFLYFGIPQGPQAKQLLDQQDRGETERLLYVAMTRARVKLYLPYIAKLNGKLVFNKLNGRHKILNERLSLMDVKNEMDENLFKISIAYKKEWMEAKEALPLLEDLSSLTRYDIPQRRDLSAIRPKPLELTSYSKMKQGSYEVESFKGDATKTHKVEDDLPAGTSTGLFLHELLERVDFEVVKQAKNQDEWQEAFEVLELFETIMETYNIEEKFLQRSFDLVWGALKTPFELPDKNEMKALTHSARERREVEFYIPIPESMHPSTGLPDHSKVFLKALEVNAGYLKGFIDLIFEYEGKMYFADWKSDRLDSYEKESLERHVQRNYGVQAKLYTFALARIFGIRDRASYDEKIGGFLYCFLRGLNHDKHEGFFVGRVSYDEYQCYQDELILKFSDGEVQ